MKLDAAGLFVKDMEAIPDMEKRKEINHEKHEKHEQNKDCAKLLSLIQL